MFVNSVCKLSHVTRKYEEIFLKSFSRPFNPSSLSRFLGHCSYFCWFSGCVSFPPAVLHVHFTLFAVNYHQWKLSLDFICCLHGGLNPAWHRWALTISASLLNHTEIMSAEFLSDSIIFWKMSLTSTCNTNFHSKTV